MSYPVTHLAVGTLLLLAAALYDAWKRRIPNAINGALVLAGVWAQVAERGWMAMFSGLAAGAATIALLWRPWDKGKLGGGDVKVAGAAAVWVGLSLLPQLVLVTAVAGGLVAITCYLWSSAQARREIRANVGAMTMGVDPGVAAAGSAGRVSVPYGVAVAAGALVVLWGGAWW
jgi:prepilin peptidase CpaA